jgi:predicted N-acyltransferase
MLPRQTLVFLARDGDEYIAGAYAMRGARTLYGRHWGCSRDLPLLHFELCYYRTIDYCIEHHLDHLDAGAQGEHKIPRGFEPVTTYSAHHLREPVFRRVIADFLRRESAHVARQVQNIAAHSPYRASESAIPPP